MTTASIFDVDEFINGCRAGLAEADTRRAIREVVQRAMTHPGAVADALRPEKGGFSLLHHAPRTSSASTSKRSSTSLVADSRTSR